GCEADQVAQVVDGVFVTAVAVDRIAWLAIGIDQLLAGNPAHAADRCDRHRGGGLADLDEYRLGDGQRLRPAQGEGGALSGPGVDVQRAAELADLAGDHVHADAAAGEPAHFAGGGEARLEDEHVQVGIGQYRVLADKAALDAAPADRVAVQATPVVPDFQHHFRAFAADRDPDRAFLGLA